MTETETSGNVARRRVFIRDHRSNDAKRSSSLRLLARAWLWLRTLPRFPSHRYVAPPPPPTHPPIISLPTPLAWRTIRPAKCQPAPRASLAFHGNALKEMERSRRFDATTLSRIPLTFRGRELTAMRRDARVSFGPIMRGSSHGEESRL